MCHRSFFKSISLCRKSQERQDKMRAMKIAQCYFQLLLFPVVFSSKFRPSLRLEDLNSSSLMLPVNSDSFSSNSLNEEAKLDARIARVRRLLGQFEAEQREERDNFVGPVFYDAEEEFVYNEYSDDQDESEDYRSSGTHLSVDNQ